MYDVSADELIRLTAEELKKLDSLHPPQWAAYVKTGVHKERPPVEQDWWYVRAASVLRKVYILGPVGVSKLRRKYGGKRNMGARPEHFFKGSGNILRKISQQLEAAGLLQKSKTSRAGRIVSAKGRSLLDGIAANMARSAPAVAASKPKAKPKKEEAAKEEPKAKPQKEDVPDAEPEKKPKAESKKEAKE